jgi:hypothetical protein
MQNNVAASMGSAPSYAARSYGQALWRLGSSWEAFRKRRFIGASRAGQDPRPTQ